MKPWYLKEEKLQCKCLKCANHRTRICNPSRKKAEQSTYAQTWNHYVNAGKKSIANLRTPCKQALKCTYAKKRTLYSIFKLTGKFSLQKISKSICNASSWGICIIWHLEMKEFKGFAKRSRYLNFRNRLFTINRTQ